MTIQWNNFLVELNHISYSGPY